MIHVQLMIFFFWRRIICLVAFQFRFVCRFSAKTLKICVVLTTIHPVFLVRFVYVWMSFTSMFCSHRSNFLSWPLQVTMGDPKSMGTLAILLFCYPVNYLKRWISSGPEKTPLECLSSLIATTDILLSIYVFLIFFVTRYAALLYGYFTFHDLWPALGEFVTICCQNGC